ncbi:MAG TPA: NUDIX domain-containing protein [Thermoplasmata archaeon]
MDPAEPPVAQECVEGYLFAGRPPQLLVLRRPPARGRIWVPVSGKVDATDRDFPSAIAREVLEETGFSDFRDLFPLEWEVRFEGPDGRPWRLHAYGIELADRASPRLSAEHEAFEWLEFDEAGRRLHYADNREAVARLAARVTDPKGGAPSPKV